jgi:hypothetical protein
MPMLLLCVGWYLPLQTPSSKIALPTQKLISYLTLKLTTHMLPYPKTQHKTHNPHATLLLPKTHTCCETMPSPSEVVGWERVACTFTSDDAMCCNCLACQARRLVHYAIVAGTTAAAMARTTKVDLCNQACVAALPTAGPVVAGEADTSANGAVAGEGHNAAYGPPAVAGSVAIHHRRAPQLGGNRASVVARLVNTMVNILGINAKDRGHNCPFHDCCRMQLQVGSKVGFRWERLIYCKGREEDVLTVYVVGDCTMMCKVGFSPQHLAVRADAYDGLYAHIVSVYSNRCTDMLKREKHWRNKGCCVTHVLGDCFVLSIYLFRNLINGID